MNEKTNKDRIQTMLERQKRHLRYDKLVAFGVTLGMLLCISGLA